MDKQNSEQVPKERPDKKPYAAPRLIEYGTIAKLTQGLLTVGTDSGPQGMEQQCL